MPVTTAPQPVLQPFANRGSQASPPYSVHQPTSLRSRFDTRMDWDVKKFHMGSSPPGIQGVPEARPVEPIRRWTVGTPVSQNALPSVETIPVATIDYSGRYAVSEAFRKKVSDLYFEGNYRASVHQCTLALAAHNSMAIANGSDDRRATLAYCKIELQPFLCLERTRRRPVVARKPPHI